MASPHDMNLSINGPASAKVPLPFLGHGLNLGPLTLADASSTAPPGEAVETAKPSTQPTPIVQARIDPLKDQPHSIEAKETRLLAAGVMLVVVLLVLAFGIIVMRRVFRHQRAQAALAARRAGLAAAPNHNGNDPWKAAADRMKVPSEDDQPGND